MGAEGEMTLTPEQTPLLVVAGLHRSGTSALARLLATSPQIRAMTGTGVHEDEGQHLQTVYPTAQAHGGPGIFAFDPGAHLTERSWPARPVSASALLDAWSPYWHLDGDAGGLVLLEKSPPDLVRTRLLQALFPQARFVVILRHPAVVTVSTARWRPWLSPGALLRHWLHAHQVYRRDKPRLARVHELRYERLVADPAVELSALALALDLENTFDPDVLERGHDERHLVAWPQLRDRMPVEERRALDRQVRRYGYRLHEPYTA
jgi:hypothetical protein